MTALVLARAGPSGFLNKAMLVLGACAGTLLCLSALALLTKRRSSSSAMWVAMSIWLSFFTWFGWVSNGSPFIQNEFHSFDPAEMAIESHRFKVNAIITFLAFVLWYLGYAFVWLSRTRRTTRSPSK
jgi:hypothetical protein